MFNTANLDELRRITQGVITQEAVEEGKTWKLDDHQRRQIRRAMFGPGKPNSGNGHRSVREQREMLNQFTKMVVDPIIESLPQDIAACAVLVLYEEFVDAVFIQPSWEEEGGAGD